MPSYHMNSSQPDSTAPFPGKRHDDRVDGDRRGVEISTHVGGIAPCIVWDRYAPPEHYTGPRAVLPLILVHGANHAAAIYAQWGQYLASVGITVYAIDLRGHGRSTMPRGETVNKAHLWQYADDIHTLVQQERLTEGQFILAGHSLGGAVVQLYARTHPVAGLVILASTALTRFMLGFMALGLHAPVAYVQAMVQGPGSLFNTPAKIRRFLLESDADDASVQRVQDQLGGEASTMSTEILHWHGESYRHLRTAHILVMGGDADALFPVRELERCAHYYGPTARVQIVPATPHDLMVGRTWQRCADELAHFIDVCGVPWRAAE